MVIFNINFNFLIICLCNTLIVYYMVYETIFPDNFLKVGDGEEVKISCLHQPGSLIKITEVKYGDKHEDCDPSAFDKVVQLCNGNATCNFTVNSTNATTFDANECDASSSSDELMLRIKYECIGMWYLCLFDGV